jgi:AcrR family transcriptional regulator
VTEGLIFHYFGTKDGLLLESMARQNTFAGRVLANVRRASDGSARELFAAVASAYAEVSAEEMALVGFFEAEAQTNRSLRTSVVAGTEMMVTDFSALLALRVQRGELRPTASLRAAAYGFFGGFSFFFAQHRDATAAAWRSEAARFASAWSDQCWRGLATPSALALVDGPTLSEGSVTRAAGRRRKKAT